MIDGGDSEDGVNVDIATVVVNRWRVWHNDFTVVGIVGVRGRKLILSARA